MPFLSIDEDDCGDKDVLDLDSNYDECDEKDSDE